MDKAREYFVKPFLVDSIENRDFLLLINQWIFKEGS